MASNHVGAFGYRLHDQQCFGRAVDLIGVPQIPRAAHAFMVCEGSDGALDLPPHLEREANEANEAIEAACWVLKNRHDQNACPDPENDDAMDSHATGGSTRPSAGAD